MKADTSLPLWVWPLVAAVLLCQGAWIYRDASRRGENKFLWGLFGLVSCPSSLLVYLVVTRVLAKKVECPHCGAKMPQDARFCPACGKGSGRGTP